MTHLTDGVRSRETLAVVRYTDPGMSAQEWADLAVQVELGKYADMDHYLAHKPFEIARFGKPTLGGGLLTNIGGNFICKLLRGDVTPSGTGGSAAAPSMTATGVTSDFRFFDNARCKIGVGINGDVQPPGGTAAAQTDLDLAGSTRTRIAMSNTFPLVKNGTYTNAAGTVITVSDRQIVFRSLFGSSDHSANWYEFTISNGGAGTGAIETTPGQTFTILDHFISDQGRKVAGQVWEPTVTFTLT